MKKLNYLAGMFAAAGMVLSTSCSQEEFDVTVPGQPCEVSFMVSAPASVQSRAYSDGLTATELQYAVYDANGKHLTALDGTATMENGATTVNIQLVSGSDYTLLFWSAAADAPYTVTFTENLDDANMVVNYDAPKCNEEVRDAFFKVFPYKADGNQPETVKLRRPFAQLNIGTNDWEDAVKAGFTPAQTSVKTTAYTTLKFNSGAVEGEPVDVTFEMAPMDTTQTFPVAGNLYLAMNYILMGTDAEPVDVFFTCESTDGEVKTREFNVIDLERNHRTNIYGKLLTSSVDFNVEIEEEYEDDDKYGSNDGVVYVKVSNSAEFNAAFANEGVDLIILTDDIVLDSVMSRAAANPSYTITKNKALTIDLGTKKLSANSTQTGKNVNMFDVNGGTLTVKNGTIEIAHTGDNMAWNNSTNVFNVTNGGVLNLQGVTANNLGGSDMAFVAHLNNWGEVTLNVENCVLESSYIPVRVFNSGPDMNNVTIKNSTLKGANYAFWVHNYTVEDFGSQAKADAQKKLLNLDIFNQGNTFVPDLNGVLFGFTNPVKADAYGITKTVSEDGSVVTLGSVVENGIIRRGVAGTEGNSEITKAIVTDGVAVLYDRTFNKFSVLETVELPGTLTTIGVKIFQSCSALKNVVIPESVTSIGEGAFYECGALTSINIPSGVTRIEKDALRGTGLTSVEFHSGVTYFGEYAFRDCENLSEMTINAPEFTVHSSNTFLNAAAPYNTMTIYVVNSAMKTYLESVLTTHQKSYITVVVPDLVTTADEFASALAAGNPVMLGANITYSKNFTNDAVINLNNFTFEATSTLTLSNNSDFKMYGGDYVKNNSYGHVDVRPSSVDGGVVTYENVDFTNNYKSKTYGPCTNRLGSVLEFCALNSGAKSVIKFKNCKFDNAKVVFEGMSGIIGEVEAVFEGCTFDALTSSAPIEVVNFVTGSIKVVDCVFNLTCTSSTASAIAVTSNTNTSVIVTAENNTIKAVAAVPSGEAGTVDEVKVNGTPANIKFISIGGTTSSATETGTIKSGIAL